MNDKELLEMAAKAAGIELGEWYDSSNAFIHVISHKSPWWNPLTDDGDALRLAVSLGLCIMFDRDSVQVSSSDGGEYCTAFSLETANSSEGATRRAIVRAAAEIGKVKP